jgi:hypothetical protein
LNKCIPRKWKDAKVWQGIATASKILQQPPPAKFGCPWRYKKKEKCQGAAWKH